MKTFKLLFVLSLFVFLSSCRENEKEITENAENELVTGQEVPNSDEVIENWNNAWSSNDTAQVRAMTADDAVLVLNGREFPQDSLDAWVQAAGAVMKDLQMQSLKKGSTENMAYDTGTYSHTYTTDTTQYAGSYTFIWERSNDENEWKVKAMNISETQPQQN